MTTHIHPTIRLIKYEVEKNFYEKLLKYNNHLMISSEGSYTCNTHELTSKLLFSSNDDFDVAIGLPDLCRVALKRTEEFLDTLLLENL
jgi:peptide methionine sulfoxide reductase MsrB